MEARVYRGVGVERAALRIAALVIVYVGACAVLSGLGLAVRGWPGAVLVAAPLVAWIALRLWTFHRVSAELTDGVLRYEGAAPRDDFELEVRALHGFYFDRTLRDAPLVVVATEGDERVLAELSPLASRALGRHLLRLGVRRIRASSAP